jgi:hypothetical protein
MSVDAINPSTAHEVVALHGPEALVIHRKNLQRRLGEASSRLCDATKEYNDCISEILATNEALMRAGIDTNALGRELQAGIGIDADE